MSTTITYEELVRLGAPELPSPNYYYLISPSSFFAEMFKVGIYRKKWPFCLGYVTGFDKEFSPYWAATLAKMAYQKWRPAPSKVPFGKYGPK